MRRYGLSYLYQYAIISILVLELGAACQSPGSELPAPGATPTPVATDSTSISDTPVVFLTSPVAGQKFESDQAIRVQSESIANTGISRLELMVNDRVVASNEFVPQPGTALITKQAWIPDLPGRYVLQVRAYTPANLVGQSGSVVVQIAPTGETGVAITAEVPIAASTVTSTPTPDRPTATLTATPRPSSAQSTLPTRTSTPTPVLAVTPTPDFPYLQVNADLSLNIRSGPSTQYGRVGALQPGEVAEIRGQNDIGAGHWWQISFPSAPGAVGWVSSSPNYSTAFNISEVPVVPVPPLPVAPTPTPTQPPATSPTGGLDFTVDRTQVQAGDCVTFRWNVSNVKEVYYRGGGVPGDNQTRVECPTWPQAYELRVVYRDGTINSKTINIEVIGGSAYRTVDMEAGQTIDFDKDAKVTDDDGDDFEMKEEDDDLIFEKWDDDDDLVQVPVGPVDSLDIVRKQDCDWALDNLDDTKEIKPFDGLAVCFRTDDGRVGKLRFDDVGNDDARIQWALW